MFDLKEAIVVLRQLRCQNHFTNNEIFEYHTCLNIIEDALCDNRSIFI